MTTRLKRVLADPAVDAVIIATPGIADVALVTLTFASGVIANVELSWLAPSKLRRTVLVGQTPSHAGADMKVTSLAVMQARARVLAWMRQEAEDLLT